jgi:hypothetical protein
MKHITTILVSALLLSAAACSKGSKGEPCDAKALAGLSSSAGKRLAFKGCSFQSQGNDVVAFGDATKNGRIDCTMKGGEAAVKDFRHAAQAIGLDKLKLDVEGTVTADGDSVVMKDCEISAHD